MLKAGLLGINTRTAKDQGEERCGNGFHLQSLRVDRFNRGDGFRLLTQKEAISYTPIRKMQN